jgi:hypothetical protein
MKDVHPIGRIADVIKTETYSSTLAPARLFIHADPQCGFRHHFMREEGIRRVDPAQTRIAD